MRTTARIVLALVLLMGALIVLPRSASRVLIDDAQAQLVQPTPTLPDLLGTPKPTPTEEEAPPDEEEENEGSSGAGSNDDEKSGQNSDGKDAGRKDGGKAGDAKDNLKKGKKKRGKRGGVPGGGAFVGYYQPGGSFSTAELVAVAAQLQGLGMAPEEVARKVYPPFIVAGDAAWSNTWGAPRFGPGPIVRTHEGQDVFCHYGDPVIASEAGKVSYSNGGLGGITARVHTSDDSYWYYTHLSGQNKEQFPAGSYVAPGDVIGYCGNSGNAETTPPHVHFGWYVNGVAKNPHKALVRWLHEAEARALQLVAEKSGEQVKQIERLTLARRFGDSFAPDLSELSVSGESLWAAGASPEAGAFGLAEAALQAALAQQRAGAATTVVYPAAADHPERAPSPAMFRLIDGSPTTYRESGD